MWIPVAYLVTLMIIEQDLDKRCEQLIKEVFDESCNFDVDDAVQKLERLGIITRVRTYFLPTKFSKYVQKYSVI